MDLLAGGWAKLAGILGVVAALAAGWFQIRKSGRDAERVKQQEAWRETETRVDAAVAQADSRSDDAMRQRLRERAIDAPGAGDTVRDR